MNMTSVGKFEMRRIMDEFDATLIRLYGMNMLDASVTRYEALSTTSEFNCPRKAAEVTGLRRGLSLQSV